MGKFFFKKGVGGGQKEYRSRREYTSFIGNAGTFVSFAA